jgi:hypothetical protein
MKKKKTMQKLVSSLSVGAIIEQKHEMANNQINDQNNNERERLSDSLRQQQCRRKKKTFFTFFNVRFKVSNHITITITNTTSYE